MPYILPSLPVCTVFTCLQHARLTFWERTAMMAEAIEARCSSSAAAVPRAPPPFDWPPHLARPPDSALLGCVYEEGGRAPFGR